MKIGRLNISWTCYRCDDTGGCPSVGKLFFLADKEKVDKKQKDKTKVK